jgi:hypothetical protein
MICPRQGHEFLGFLLSVPLRWYSTRVRFPRRQPYTNPAMPASLPSELIAPQPPTLADLPLGATGWISPGMVKVDQEHFVYLDKSTELSFQPENGMAAVRRDEAGRYHWDLRGGKHQYWPENLDLEKKYSHLLPVESVTV